jgi:hypothetical protein
MKAVVLLWLVAGLASGSAFPGFYTGLEEGKQGPWFCLQNPSKCGETLGQLWQIASSSANLSLRPQPWAFSSVQSFLQGLTIGLRGTNLTLSDCVADFQQGNYDIAVLYETFWDMFLDYYDPISLDTVVEGACAGTYLWALPYLQDCRFNVLLGNIQNISIEIIQQIYLQYMCEINTSVANILRCQRDFEYCGYNVGFLVKTFFNWSI